jgi:lipopolysaccharide export system protein LptA
MKRTVAVLLTLAFTALPAGVAFAQLAPSTNGPIDVTADQLGVQNKLCLASYKGSVEALQGTSRLRANSLDVYAKTGGAQTTGAGGVSTKCGDIERLVADGSVYYATPQEVVKGDHAVYLADEKTITVTGDVVISQGKNVVVGNRLVINTDTGQATMESDVKGRGQPGRVRSVIYPGAQSGGLFPASPARP